MKTIGGILVALALVIGIVPRFTDCQSQGSALELANGRTIPMKCHWTAQAELGLAVPLLAVGALVVGSRRRETLQRLSIIAIVLGGGVIALPTFLIGVCGNPDMICNAVMKPTLTFAGILTAGAGLVGVVALRRPEGGVLQN